MYYGLVTVSQLAAGCSVYALPLAYANFNRLKHAPFSVMIIALLSSLLLWLSSSADRRVHSLQPAGCSSQTFHPSDATLFRPLSSPMNAPLLWHLIGPTVHYSNNTKATALTPQWCDNALASLNLTLDQGRVRWLLSFFRAQSRFRWAMCCLCLLCETSGVLRPIPPVSS